MSRSHFYIPSSKTSNVPVGKGLGGAKFDREDYTSHGERLNQELVNFKSNLSSLDDYEYSENVYAKIESPPEVKIQNIKSTLDRFGISLTGVDPENSSRGYAYFKKDELPKIEAALSDYASHPKNPLKSYIKFIESIATIDVSDKLQDDIEGIGEEVTSFILNLHAEVSEEKADLLIGMLREKFDVGTETEKTFIDDVLKTISIRANQEEITNICNEFSLVHSVSLNPPSLAPNSIQSDPIANGLIVNRNDDNPTVIVIDSGVNNSGLLAGLIKQAVQSLPSGVTAPHYNHGTFVASRIAFGDELDRIVTNGQIEAFCNIIDVAVLGQGMRLDGTSGLVGPSRAHMCQILNSAAVAYKDQSRVVNVSMGEGIAIQGNAYTQSAFIIDYLSRKYDMIFVIASGNIDSPLGNFPSAHYSHNLARINSPAESILGITVGSIAKHEDVNALSKTNQISPFSRRGPGFNNGIKPELVHHGGNLLNNYQPYARIATSGLFQNGTHLATDNGTSFAAPLVSQIAARLFSHYGDRSSNLIKALMIHFADKANSHVAAGVASEQQVGFGVPNFERALYAGNHSATYLYEGKVKNDFFHIVKFHIPLLMASDNPNTKMKIKVTAVANPPVNHLDFGRYVQSKITVQLDKLNDNNDKKQVGLTGDDRKVTDWSPIQQLEKSFTRSYSTGEWELKVRGWTRGGLSEDFEQDFAVIIEIIDENGNGDPYNGILEETGDTYFTRVISIHRAA